MKNITSKTFRSLYDDLIFVCLFVSFIERIWDNAVLHTLASIIALLFIAAFIAALVKGWFETKSIKQVYKDNKVYILILGVFAVIVLIVLLLQAAG